ncbi:MAG TPA: LemA family protein [Kofleriaceae bacterium]|nr:LemA family protein [Kofleriaceae bacterium]
MSKKWIPVAVIGGIALVLILFSVTRYNSLVNKSEEVDGAWAQIENQLQRRADLIPNLVETVKGFAAHEKAVIDSVANARAKLAGARGPAEAGAANGELSSALSRLLVVVENYPQLKANENFIRLQDELAGTENRIATERRRYNEVVREFNTTIKRFPSNMFAGMFGFDAREYFQAAEGAEKAPQVKFN